MNLTIKLLFFFIAAGFCYGFSYQPSIPIRNFNISHKDTTAQPPKFKDGGKVVESLKRAYNCESIEFENWEDDDATDSSLTVCLVNSRIKSAVSFDEDFRLLKDVASQIKKALVNPEHYKSYYIIFVTEAGDGLLRSRSHTLGAEMPSTDL